MLAIPSFDYIWDTLPKDRLLYNPSLSPEDELPFIYIYIFLNYVFIVKVQETAGSASYGVNKTINNPTAHFTLSWEKLKPLSP